MKKILFKSDHKIEKYNKSLLNQRGLSLLSLIFYGIIFIFIAFLATSVFPYVSEFGAVKRAVKSASTSGDSVREIQSVFDKQANIDNIRTINGKDLTIIKNKKGEWIVSFAYSVKIELFAPVSLVIDFNGSSEQKPPSL